MSNPNTNYSNLDARYTKPVDVDTKIATQATTDSGLYLSITGNNVFQSTKYPSLQAALDAAASAGGGTVRLPVGPTYIPSGGVHIPSRVILAGPQMRHTDNQFTQVDANGYYRPQGINTTTGLATYDGAYLVPVAGSTGPMVWTGNYDVSYGVKDVTIFGVDVFGQNITPAAIPSWTNSFAWVETAGTIASGSTAITMSVLQPMPQMVGKGITGSGIPVNTTITAVNVAAKTATLSSPATASSGTATFTVSGGLTVPATPISGRQAISFGSGAGSLSRTRALIENVYTWGCGSGGPGTMINYRSWSETNGNTLSGSNMVQLSSVSGSGLMISASVTGPGIPANTVVSAVDALNNRLYLSAAATASGSGIALTIGGSSYTSSLQSVYSGVPAIYIGCREIVIHGLTCFMGGGDGLVIDAQDGQMDLDNMMGFNSGWGWWLTLNSGPFREVGAIDCFNNGIYGAAGNAYIEGSGHAILKLQCNVAGQQNVKFGRCINTAIYYLNATDAGIRALYEGVRYSSITYAAPTTSTSNPVWNTGNNAGVVIFGGATSSQCGFENYTFEDTGSIASIPNIFGMVSNGTMWNAGSPSTSAFAIAKAFITNWRFIGGNFPDRIMSGFGIAPYVVGSTVGVDTLQFYGPSGNAASGVGARGSFYQAVNTQTLSVNGAVTIDASYGNFQVIALGANASSSTITNAKTGQVMTIEWQQDATGSRTYAWPSNCKFANAAAPSASTTATYVDSVTFRYDGTNWREVSRSIAIH